MKSIKEQELRCPNCGSIQQVMNCVCEAEITPDDDDGCLCCSWCWHRASKKIIMEMIEEE